MHHFDTHVDFTFIIILSILILVLTSPSTSFRSYNPEQQAWGQKISPAQTAKVFLDDAVKALKNKDTKGAIFRLSLAKQQLENAAISTSIQTSKVFVQDALQALHTGEAGKAIERTSLAEQQLTSSSDRNEVAPVIGPKTAPVQRETYTKTFFIQLYWDPPVIEPRKTVKFHILFKDRSKAVLNHVTYSFSVKDPAGDTIVDRRTQYAIQGIGVQNVKFDRPGSMKIIVSVDSIPGKSAGGLADFADFPVVVNRGTSNITASSGNVTAVSSPANRGNSTVTFKVGDKAYPVKYQITGGKVNGVAIEKDNSTIEANISTATNGEMTIELPRNVIDSKNPGNVDDKYVVFIDGQNVAFDEIKNNNQVRTLVIAFDNGAQQIAIAGTHVLGQIESHNKSSTDMMTPSKSKGSITRFLTYENSKFGIKIRYPHDWDKQENTYFDNYWLYGSSVELVTFYPPLNYLLKNPHDYLAHVVVLTSPTNASDINEQLSQTITQIKENYPSIIINESTANTRLAENRAYKLTWMNNTPNIFERNPTMQIATIIGNELYEIQYYGGSQYTRFLPDVYRMIQSLQINPAPLTAPTS